MATAIENAECLSRRARTAELIAVRAQELVGRIKVLKPFFADCKRPTDFASDRRFEATAWTHFAAPVGDKRCVSSRLVPWRAPRSRRAGRIPDRWFVEPLCALCTPNILISACSIDRLEPSIATCDVAAFGAPFLFHILAVFKRAGRARRGWVRIGIYCPGWTFLACSCTGSSESSWRTFGARRLPVAVVVDKPRQTFLADTVGNGRCCSDLLFPLSALCYVRALSVGRRSRCFTFVFAKRSRRAV